MLFIQHCLIINKQEVKGSARGLLQIIFILSFIECVVTLWSANSCMQTR